MGSDDIGGIGKMNLGNLQLLSNAPGRAELLAKRYEVQPQTKEGVAAKAGSARDTPEEIQKAATQFESMLLQQMLKSMWETVPKGGMFSGSNEEGYYRDMLNEAMATDIAEKQSIGVSEVIAKDISRIAQRGQKK